MDKDDLTGIPLTEEMAHEMLTKKLIAGGVSRLDVVDDLKAQVKVLEEIAYFAEDVRADWADGNHGLMDESMHRMGLKLDEWDEAREALDKTGGK